MLHIVFEEVVLISVLKDVFKIVFEVVIISVLTDVSRTVLTAVSNVEWAVDSEVISVFF